MMQLAWQTGHLALFQRNDGVRLWVQLDNLKTGVATGAGPTVVLNTGFSVSNLHDFQTFDETRQMIAEFIDDNWNLMSRRVRQTRGWC